MTLQQAIKKFTKEVDRKPIGYWFDGSNYIFNTVEQNPELLAPAQYIVTPDGDVYGTNPLRNPIIMDMEMEKLE